MKQLINKRFYGKSVFHTAVVSAAVVASVFLAAPVTAASQCKGLESSACGEAASCSWVNAYERKDGRKVNGFCRTKAKRNATKPESKAESNGTKQG